MNMTFIGLGHMGNPMAKNLLNAGHQLKVYDVSKNAVEKLVSAGAAMSLSIADAVKEADVIFTMLQTGQQVKAVCVANGIFAHAKKTALYIDSSSIDITTTHELHEHAKNIGLAMLDAPVSGGVAGATAATLTIMVGGQEEHFLRARPLLEKIGKKIVYAGEAGHGQVAKICNNLMLGISMLAVSEGFSLAQKLGLDAKKLFEIAANSSSQCWSMTSYCPVPGLVETAPSNNQYQPGFTSKMMLKDLRLGQRAAENADASIPLGAAAAELYSMFVNQGNGELDFSAIIKLFS